MLYNIIILELSISFYYGYMTVTVSYDFCDYDITSNPNSK